jgi:hypothetical protein
MAHLLRYLSNQDGACGFRVLAFLIVGLDHHMAAFERVVELLAVCGWCGWSCAYPAFPVSIMPNFRQESLVL